MRAVSLPSGDLVELRQAIESLTARVAAIEAWMRAIPERGGITERNEVNKGTPVPKTSNIGTNKGTNNGTRGRPKDGKTKALRQAEYRARKKAG